MKNRTSVLANVCMSAILAYWAKLSHTGSLCQLATLLGREDLRRPQNSLRPIGLQSLSCRDEERARSHCPSRVGPLHRIIHSRLSSSDDDNRFSTESRARDL